MLEPANPSGLLVVDKPSGPTSHDVVSRVRKVMGMRSVGHAGTLDPMASGVLLMLLGECTKLSRFLTLESKSYRARIRLGVGTDTLDAQGRVVAEAAVAQEILEQLAVVESGRPAAGSLARALDCEAARKVQRPPAFSAIKQQGTRAYVLARRGEDVQMQDRAVQVERIMIVGASAEPSEVQLEMSVSKGYYVRALARDFGESLGVPAHLVALRRTRIGPYRVDEATALDQLDRTSARIIALSDAVRAAMPCVVLTQAGVRRALCGQCMDDGDFESAPSDHVCGWLNVDGDLVAVGDRSAGRPTVVRAFPRPEGVC